MNRTDRLLALVLELRVRGTCRAEDLATFFGTSKRTIYRDIQALSEMGVPVVALMGEGYSLAEGYFLPPLSFTADEATLILLGLSAVQSSFDREYQAIIDDSRRKIRAVLSDDTRQRADNLCNSLLLTNMQPISPAELHLLRLLRRAIFTTQTVKFRYFTRYPDKVSLREADPYGLACLNGTWYLTAYCHLRQDRRMFRLSRMQDAQLTARHFEYPADYVIGSESRRDDRSLRIKLLFDEDVEPWILEDHFFYIDQRELHPDGVLVTLRARQIDEVLQWILGWGRHVRVLEPDELRDRMRDEARAMLDNHN
ncbi:MAG TPA: YafY family protein [Aggregatilineaceae bacterium]|nr:YafY family protein [Aggregatilineaceae bacterium]